MNALLPYAQLVRLPNVFTAWADIVMAALVTGALVTHRLPFVLLLIASTLLYWAGMVWNDYFDLDQDRMERPGRPLPSGRVSVSAAYWLGVALTACGIALALAADLVNGVWVALPISVCLVMSILLYDGALKTSPVGPALMGACRFFNVLLGLAAVGAFPPAWGVLLAFVVGLYIAGVTLFARTEAVASRRTTLLAAAGIMLLALLLALAVPALAEARLYDITTSPLFPYLLVAFGFNLALAVVPAIRQPAPGKVQPAVKRSLLGLVLLDALLACALVGTAGLLIAILLVPGVLLGRWLYST
jgi:4-hydroxybenzoate polyprenyltransferase